MLCLLCRSHNTQCTIVDSLYTLKFGVQPVLTEVLFSVAWEIQIIVWLSRPFSIFEITSLDSWKGEVTQLSLNSCLGVGFSVEFYFFFPQKMGNTVGISWIGKTLMDGRVLGFLGGSPTWDWQGHTILLMKMPSGQPSITQSAALCSRAGMLGYNPAEVANRFKQTQIMLQHCCPSGKRQLPRGTLQPLLFIRKICENVDLPSLLNPDL